jgi:hypothetical protein
MTLPTPINYPPVDANPTQERSLLGGVYVAKRKSFFLGLMMRTIAASNDRLFHFIPGTILHQILSVISEAMERLSFDAQEVGLRAIRESAYAAWRDDVLFPARGNATFSRGYVTLSLPDIQQSAETIPAGTMATTRDGRVVQFTDEGIFPAGVSQVSFPVISQAAGTAGIIQAGEISRLLGGTRTNYQVGNPAAIAGGQDEESDEQIYRRFQDFVQSRSTGNRLAVYSAGMNARVGGEVVVDAVLVSPWTLPDLNQEMGYGSLVIDNGSGGASNALVVAAQTGVNLVVSALESVGVIPADAFVVSPTIEIRTTRTATPSEVDTAVRAAWDRITRGCRIEDGRGRGLLRLYDIEAVLDKAHPDIVSIKFINLTDDIQPPLAAKIVSGLLTLNIVRGDVIRP